MVFGTGVIGRAVMEELIKRGESVRMVNWRSFIPEAKETVEMMDEFEEPFAIDSSKFEETFGMRATPMRQAIKETVAWYKSHPE